MGDPGRRPDVSCTCRKDEIQRRDNFRVCPGSLDDPSFVLSADRLRDRNRHRGSELIKRFLHHRLTEVVKNRLLNLCPFPDLALFDYERNFSDRVREDLAIKEKCVNELQHPGLVADEVQNALINPGGLLEIRLPWDSDENPVLLEKRILKSGAVLLRELPRHRHIFVGIQGSRSIGPPKTRPILLHGSKTLLFHSRAIGERSINFLGDVLDKLRPLVWSQFHLPDSQPVGGALNSFHYRLRVILIRSGFPSGRHVISALKKESPSVRISRAARNSLSSSLTLMVCSSNVSIFP